MRPLQPTLPGIAAKMLCKEPDSPRTTCQAVALVVARFETAIQAAAETGRCEDAQLYSAMLAIRLHATGTVQPCEGVNSLIRFQDQRSPNIGLPLLSARIKLKKALGIGSRSAPKGWRLRREGARKLVELCNSVSARWQQVRREQRYTTPAPVALQPPVIVQFNVQTKAWAATWAMYLNKRIQQNFSDGKLGEVTESTLDYCVLIGTESETHLKHSSPAQQNIWLVAQRFKKLLTAVRCLVSSDQNDQNNADDSRFVLDIAIPLQVVRALGVPW